MSTLRDIALRSTGGALGGSVLGAAVAPEGHRLEGAGYGALGGGLAGAGTLAFRGKPVSGAAIEEALPAVEPFFHAGTAHAAVPTAHLRANPRTAPAIDPVKVRYQAEHAPHTGDALSAHLAELPDSAFTAHPETRFAPENVLRSMLPPGKADTRFAGALPARKKTAAYAAGLNDTYAALGLQKEALAPLVGAGIRAAATRALPALARGVSSVMRGGRAAATGIRSAASTVAKAAPRTTSALKGGFEVANHPATQVASMIPTPKPQRL